MTATQAKDQSAAYRTAAEDYRRKGNAFIANALTELANRIDATIKAQAAHDPR